VIPENLKRGGQGCPPRFVMTPLDRMIVRGVPATFDRCIKRAGETRPIDIGLAREQHRVYCETIEDLGVRVLRIAPDDRYPDSCFVEDPLIIVGDHVICADSAAPARRGEAETLLDPLRREHRVDILDPPATMDGGDVFRAGRVLYVGLSTRTNPQAAEQLRALLAADGYEIRPLEVRGVLHLKSACTPVGDDTVLVSTANVDARVFADKRLIVVPPDESYAANCLAVKGRVLVVDGYPKTRETLEKAGYETIALEMSEFYKAGGSLTCLSLFY
jgi:dimethylargininase